MRRSILPAALAVLAMTAIVFPDEKPSTPPSAGADGAAKMAAAYKPGHFDSSTFYLIASSHNDNAYLDDPQGTADFRAESLLGPALDMMNIDASFTLDIENTLFLKEFLQRYPERIEEVRRRVEEKRLGIGGRYTQFYEALFGGEALARQMYFGRKWLKKTLGGDCDTRIVWDTDVPQRTLQSPQVFAKAGIKYLMIGRFPTPGIFVWESPDGSGVIFDAYLYTAGWGMIPGRGPASTATPADTAKYVFDVLQSQAPFFHQHRLPNFGSVTMSDYSCPGLELVDTVEAFNKSVEVLRQRSDLSPPRMKLATAETFLASIRQAKPSLKRIKQDWPNPWGYIHQPSHQRIVSKARRGYHRLVAAERFALVASLLNAEDRPYPQQRLNQGWEGLLYPDHGWCGEKTLETIRVFSERLQKAHDIGQSVYQSSLQYIARRVRSKKRAGTALVVFNPLSWQRTGPVSCPIRFHRGEARGDCVSLADAHGQPLPCQTSVKSRYPDGTLRELALCFVAQGIPSIGYKTYYLSTTSEPQSVQAEENLPGDGILENDFYRLQLGDRGIRSLIDKQTGAEIFDTRKFLANELFMLGVAANPDPQSGYTFYPINDRTETLENFGRFSDPMKLQLVETGNVKTVVAMHASSPHLQLRQEITLYHQIKRIDLSTELDWGGIRKRELRLAFPIKTAANPQISYDVPFGVVEVGKNEMGSAMPREVQNWVDVSNARGGVTLATGTCCLNDLGDVTKDPLTCPLIQPVLLCTLLDFQCPGQKDHPWWTQPGRHRFDFALTTHPGTWKQNWRFGREFNNPLTAVVARDLEDADVVIDHYVGDPTEKPSSTRTHTHGILPEEFSFCSVEPSNVVISTIKKCEDDEQIVVRYFDMEGKASPANLKLFKPVESAEQTNLIEEEGVPLALKGDLLRLPSKPYSIDTVKLTLKAPRRKPTTLPYCDPMEYADQAEADRVWQKYPSYRVLSLSGEQNHTPGGGKSLKSGGMWDFASVALPVRPSMTNVSLEVWFYDSGQPDMFGAVIATPSSPRDPNGNVEFGVFPSSHFGGHGGGPTRYTYYTATGDWARQDSGITRSKGWHKVMFRFTPAGGSIHFDDKLITESPNMKVTRLLLLGNPWAGAKPMYFDDVSVRRIQSQDNQH